MKVLITGGAGFIGSHLAERLIADGHKVMVLDDLSTGSMRNIDPLVAHAGFDYRIGSVQDQPLVTELVDCTDVTVHLAAVVGVKLVVARPAYSIQTNYSGTEAVLKAAASRCNMVIISSTSEVYGKANNLPFREDDDLVLGPTSNSRWSYGFSKALDECLALGYAREEGLPVIITRLFNTAGPRQTGRYGMVLPTFASQAVQGVPITVFGTGEQRRCFAHVRDVIEALIRLIQTPAAIGQVFNIGNDCEVSIARLAELVRDSAGSHSPIVKMSYDEAYAEGFEDMQRRVPDLGKLEHTIGYRPSTPLEQIFADVIAEKRTILTAQ